MRRAPESLGGKKATCKRQQAQLGPVERMQEGKTKGGRERQGRGGLCLERVAWSGLPGSSLAPPVQYCDQALQRRADTDPACFPEGREETLRSSSGAAAVKSELSGGPP